MPTNITTEAAVEHEWHYLHEPDRDLPPKLWDLWGALVDGHGQAVVQLVQFDGETWTTQRGVRAQVEPFAWAELVTPAAPDVDPFPAEEPGPDA